MRNRIDSNLRSLAAIIVCVIGAIAAGPDASGQVRSSFDLNHPVETRPFEIVLPADTCSATGAGCGRCWRTPASSHR
jgi:hypothetical protein